MKKNLLYFLIVLSLSALVSCGDKKERTVHLDLLVCESPEDNRLTEQQVKMLIPFEKNSFRYLAQGNVLNSIKTISYSKEKTWWKKMVRVQKSLFSEQELMSDHLKGLDLSSLALENPLSVDDVNRYITNYEFVLGFSSTQPEHSSTYSFRINTKIEEIFSYIIEVVHVNNPDARILLVYNPPELSPDSIVLDKTTLIIGRAGEKKQLTATVFPAEVSEENKKIVWQSDNDAVAKVDTNGLVTAGVNGHAVIRAYTNNGLSDTCSIEVRIIKPAITPAQLNDLLNKIKNSDDNATDRFRNLLGNSLRVEGATNISNVQQLIADVSNGSHYKVTQINTDDDGKVVSVTVSK